MNADNRTVVVSGFLSREEVRDIAEMVPSLSVSYAADVAELERSVENVVAVAGHVDEEMLNKAISLKWVHSWAAGPDSQLYESFVRSKVILTCSKGNGAIPLAEHAMWMMLTLNRSATRWIRAQAERKWDRFVHGELAGLTCGIIGLGNTGKDLARKAQSFHMRVIGINRTVSSSVPGIDVYAADRLHEMLRSSDVVVVCCPLTDTTRGLIGERELREMRESSLLVCVTRGGIVDDAALLRALREGWIAGAGLDAHGQEPLGEDSEFWDLPNVLITPHNGATTAGTRERGKKIFIENLRRFSVGQELFNVVDKVSGY